LLWGRTAAQPGRPRAMLLLMVALLRTPAAEGSVYMLSDSRLNATFRGTPADLGTLSSLATVGTGRPAQNVIAAGMGPHPLWSASFVGSGLGEASISSANASCAGTSVMLGHANLSVLTFRWIGCAVELPSVTAATADGQTATWIEHARSTCGGACLAEKSKAGNCDRLPGCGHHPWGGSANCSVPAMQARCLGATGCTAFNKNCYLYHGTSDLPFAAYALQCYMHDRAGVVKIDQSSVVNGNYKPKTGCVRFSAPSSLPFRSAI